MINADKDTLSVIENGYVIPFVNKPHSYVMKNNQSALKHSDFVTSAIQELLDKSCIYEVPFIPHNVSPLSVSVNAVGKRRLILDLSVLNGYVKKDHVKFEDFKVAKELLIPQGFMYKFDLTSGYHHFSIAPVHHTYLGFSWLVNGKVVYYVFSVLPFGLSSAPKLFTKCCRCLVKYWRANGLRMVIFLDDGWGINSTFDLTEQDSRFVQETLFKSGFVVNVEKSVFVPTQNLEWLGFVWDLKEGRLGIPLRRIESAKSALNGLIDGYPYSSARKLAQFVGKVISMLPVLGNVCLLQTKSLYMVIESRRSWDARIDILNCRQCLMFWQVVFKTHTFYRQLFKDILPSVFVYSDASSVGGAAYIEHDNVVSHKLWSQVEAEKSSTYRELAAIEFSLRSFICKLAGKCVRWHTDSKNCVKIVEKGSMKPELQMLASSIYKMCIEKCISLEIVWIGRELNCKADEYSRMIDYDDYGVSQEFFEYIDSLYGPHDVDRFANDYNHKVKRFNSKFWVPNCESVDAFSVHWGGSNNWLVPPVCLVPRALNHLRHCQAKGTFVLPYWPSSAFFPILYSEVSEFSMFLVETLIFDDVTGIYVQGKNKESIFGKPGFSSGVLVVRLDCSDNANC